MTVTLALCRRPGPDFARALTEANLGPPDPERALAQHAAYVRALGALGAVTLTLDALPGHPDACFVEDAAVVVPEVAVITRPGAPSRRGEAASLEPALRKHRPIVRLVEPALLDGGDVLEIGRRFVIGLSARTNEAGAAQLGVILEEHGYAWSTAEVGEGLHLKSSVNALDDTTLLVTEAFAERPEFAEFRRIVVPAEESYAANTLAVNDALLMPEGFPRTRALLEPLARPIMTVDVSEFRKADGGLSCLSLRL